MKPQLELIFGFTLVTSFVGNRSTCRQVSRKIGKYQISRWFIQMFLRAVFTTYLLTTCVWVVSRQVVKQKQLSLPKKKLFPDHLPSSIPLGVLVGAGSLSPLPSPPFVSSPVFSDLCKLPITGGEMPKLGTRLAKQGMKQDLNPFFLGHFFYLFGHT